LAALAELQIPYGCTLHDLYFACPTITLLGIEGVYCGARTDAATCARCLGAQPGYGAVDVVAWRARHRTLLARAAFLLAPSQWVAGTLARYFPGCHAEVIELAAPSLAECPATAVNGAADAPNARPPLMLPDDDLPTVGVLGAVGPDKGARKLDRMVELARERGLRLRFVLIGYLDRLQAPWQSDDALFTVHGRYTAGELPELLAHYRVRLVVFPSAGPESFSFTLSESWAAGLPVLVPPIGALAERVEGTGAGWVLTDVEWRDEARMLGRLCELLCDERSAELAAAGQCARARPQPQLAAMIADSLKHYDAAIAAGRRNQPPATAFAPARILAALGYEPWHPPTRPETPVIPDPAATAEAVDAKPHGTAAQAAKRLVLRYGNTGPGRFLRRVTPLGIREALKARLF
jgi:glycosyltransferase involved in cell wall biosynthesis